MAPRFKQSQAGRNRLREMGEASTKGSEESETRRWDRPPWTEVRADRSLDDDGRKDHRFNINAVAGYQRSLYDSSL